jgi:DNA-binding HxlR family transcriptional regulator
LNVGTRQNLREQSNSRPQEIPAGAATGVWSLGMPAAPPPKRHPYNQWSPDARALDLVGDKWTLLIIRDLAGGPRRFVELQRVLPGISTEQLRSRLNRMVADGLLTRQRYREVPPRVDYELTERAREVLPVVGALSRWGYDWAWSPPRPGEAVDVGAILRAATGMPTGSRAKGGTVEIVVGGRGGEAIHAMHVGRDGLRIEERDEPGDADARVRGSERAWVEAFSPSGGRGGLAFEGDERLAADVLELCGAVAAPKSASDAVA